MPSQLQPSSLLLSTPSAAVSLSCVILRRMEKNLQYACIHSAEIIMLLKDKKNVYIPGINAQGRTTDNILEYIRKNYASVSSLDDIARGVHISKQYLCQVFKKETGVTVSEYLNSIRINNACDILLRGRKNITQTAILCGYSSTAYFCRVFKNIMKTTPKEYQRSSEEI